MRTRDSIIEMATKKAAASFILALLLVACGTKSTESETPTNPARATAPVPRLNAHNVFAFVEHVRADPKADRAKAEAYLQRVLDGKVKPPNHGCNNEVLCTKDADCISEECPDGFCAGGSAGGRQCIQL